MVRAAIVLTALCAGSLAQNYRAICTAWSQLRGSSHDAKVVKGTAVPAAPQGLSSVPSTPKLLGLAGVIPFIALSPPIANALPLIPTDIVANAALLQLTYGASISSFLGGVHWSLAMVNFPGDYVAHACMSGSEAAHVDAPAKATAHAAKFANAAAFSPVLNLPWVGGSKAAQESATDRYIWSVTPCLLAWPAVTMASGPGSFIVASVLGVSYMMDRSFATRGLLPPWYMVLRKYLTIGAITGLAASVGGSFTDEASQEQSA